MKIANLTIGVRLALSFSIVLLLLAAVALLGIANMSRIQDRLDTISDVNIVKMQDAATMRATVLDRMIALRNLALLSDPVQMAPEVERVQRGTAKYATAKDELARVLKGEGGGSQAERDLMAQLQAFETEIQPLMDKAVKLGLEYKAEEATVVLIKEIRPVQGKWIGAITELVDLQKKMSSEGAAVARSAYDNARGLMIALTSLAIALGIAAATLVARSITRPLQKAVAIAETVAAGDLSSRIESTSTDETGRLLTALAKMNESLSDIVGKVRAGTETIASASSEIANGNLDLSSRTEQQAGSLEETASSMEEITSAVKNNAENARQASKLATSASSVASKGGQVVAEVVDTMASINDSARKIVDIIGVIDSIAFQTNILALNAAVEAARAGEQGRGFAVVASEVRNLAQRSATAAKEIKILIDDSVEKVGAGSRLVGVAGATMSEVVESVKNVTAVVGEIAAASQEQELGIAQINQAIAEIDDVTQQNAALVEEAAAAASSLQDQASGLTQLVALFNIGPASTSGPGVDQPKASVTPTASARPIGKLISLNAKRTPHVELAPSAPRGRKNVANGAKVSEADWEEF